jgi:hypothetical protein
MRDTKELRPVGTIQVSSDEPAGTGRLSQGEKKTAGISGGCSVTVTVCAHYVPHAIGDPVSERAQSQVTPHFGVRIANGGAPPDPPAAPSDEPVSGE